MSLRTIISSSILIFAALLFAVIQTNAQDQKKPPIDQGVHWSISGVDVFLFPGGEPGYRLTVITQRNINVTYHTSINSWNPVDKELTPKFVLGDVAKTYDFEHSFTKMTIWMSLEFTVDGKKEPGLTRTFYNSITDVVPNEGFMKPAKPKS